MPSLRQSSLHLFRFAGIDVFLHWSWFLVAIFEIEAWRGRYSSISWNILEYLTLFVIVLLHEFGHALACRSVGGKAERIMLWPLGGVAYVNPPQRPGAQLWSLAAGPLVNVAFVPLTFIAAGLAANAGWAQSHPDLYQYVLAVRWINGILLAFNLLPVYPLDGGQILRSLLWFLLGRGRSLAVATVVGFIGLIGYGVLVLLERNTWDITWGIVMGGYLLMNCWGGLKAARVLLRQEKLPRRPGFACPACREAPPLAPLWRCSNCHQNFDTFATGGVCPHCGARFDATTCIYCFERRPLREWYLGAAPATPPVPTPAASEHAS
ncbi:MAG TPA: M50 family metallopeptidase [Terracidiphilus sp.]|nr:M50 family metallopeptidase [Terracidiphilus sp.]